MPRADGTRSRSGTHTKTNSERGLDATYYRNRSKVATTYGTRCHWCSVQTIPAQPSSRGRARHAHEYTVDHIVPRSKGGTNDLANLRPCCWRCNSSRGNGTTRARTQRPPRPAWRVVGSL